MVYTLLYMQRLFVAASFMIIIFVCVQCPDHVVYFILVSQQHAWIPIPDYGPGDTGPVWQEVFRDAS